MEAASLFTLSTLIIVAFVCLALGAVIASLVVRMNSIDKKTHQDIQNTLHNTSTKLAIQEEKNQHIIQQQGVIESQLQQEQSTNKEQQNELANLYAQLDQVQASFNKEQQLNNQQQSKINENQEHLLHLNKQLTRLEQINLSLQEKIDVQSEEFHEARKKSLLEFEQVANKLFEEKSNKFSVQNQAQISQLLNPLKENIQDFKKRVEETYDKESKERFSLEAKIKELVTLNQQISQDANNLTNALKGQSKTQGDWGEMILENILEFSGLVKDREYFIQASYKDKDGKRKQPDVKIKYPNDRYIIIDAKVSLVAYEQFANCEQAEEQKLYLNQHVKSLKNHIDNLHSKEYDAFDKTLDFVMLFVPIEPAYITAMQYDQQLWNYAYKKRIILISPTNLIASLKMISDIWKREHQNKNAEEIAKRGALLYDKFAGFISDMEEIDSNLQKTNKAYKNALGKLSEGQGNLISQVEKLKELGVHGKKNLPEKYRS